MPLVRYFLLVTVLMIASNTYAQNVLSGNEQKNSFRLSLFYSLDTNLSGNDIKLNDEIGYRVKYNQDNFTAGLNLQYSIIKNLVFQSGISYSDRDFAGTYYCNVCDFITAPQQEEINLQLLQVPATLKYSAYSNYLGFFGKIGVLNQLMVKKPDNYELEGNSYSLSGVLEAGVEYNFGHSFAAAISAKYTNGLTHIFENADYSYKTSGIQLNLSKEL